MAQIPTPLRAALGLMANAIEGARTLPDKAVELPVMAVSTALQFSLRAQQRYAELTLRGDEVLSRLHGLPEEPPDWATFDDESMGPNPAAPSGQPSTPWATPAGADGPAGVIAGAAGSGARRRAEDRRVDQPARRDLDRRADRPAHPASGHGDAVPRAARHRREHLAERDVPPQRSRRHDRRGIASRVARAAGLLHRARDAEPARDRNPPARPRRT